MQDRRQNNAETFTSKNKKNDTYLNLVLKAKEVRNVKSDISKMNMRELQTIIMPL